MKRLEVYKGYQLYIPRGYKKRIFIDGPKISCNLYFYNIDKAKGYINFVIKYIVKE